MEKPKGNTRRVLIATIAASSMGFLMQGSVSIALDAMQRDLNGSSTEQLWVVNAYTLFLGALILVGGGLGDRYGRKRIFSIGVWGFGVACILATIAPSMVLLIAARVAQGVFGALMVPNSLALLSAAFDDAERPRAIGLWSAFSTLASIIGPVVGGWLTGQGLWRGIFGLCIPFMLVAIAKLPALPDQKRADAPRSIGLGRPWRRSAWCASSTLPRSSGKQGRSAIPCCEGCSRRAWAARRPSCGKNSAPPIRCCR